jgi:hypothetical protein
MFGAIFHTATSQLTILFALAIDRVAKIVEKALYPRSTYFAAGLFDWVHLVRGHM